MVLTKRTANLPLICQICGDVARGINFEVMTCMSCKAFFRRHAVHPQNVLRCQMNNSCVINRLTRSTCSSCRLKKCFALGMNPKLIRYVTEQAVKQTKRQLFLLPKPVPIDLLNQDRSSLTNDEWRLLSNLVHAYDRGQILQHTQQMLTELTSLPPKIRSKPTTVFDIIGFFYSSIQSVVEGVPHYQSLPLDARRLIIQRNIDTVGTLSSIFVAREIDAMENLAYFTGCSMIYGSENILVFKNYISQMEKNGSLVKLMLLVMAFSGNSSIVIPHPRENIPTILSINALIYVQNIFVTILWKYLIHLYGHRGAIRWFNSSIKFILNVLRWTAEKYHEQHWIMVDHIVENKAMTLTS